MSRPRWIAPYLSLYRWRMLLSLLLGTLTVFAAAALMFTSGFLISKSSTPIENILMVYVPIVGVRAFGTSRAVLSYVEKLCSHDTVLRILSSMRVRLYRILAPQAMELAARCRTGDLLGLLAEDIEQLQQVFLRVVFPAAAALALYAAVVAGLGRFDAGFALLAGLYLLLLIAVLPLVSLLRTRRAQRQVKERRARLYRSLTDAVLGLDDWMLSGQQARFLGGYEDDERFVAAADGELRQWARRRQLLGQALVGFAVVAVVAWAGGEAGAGRLEPTLIAAFALAAFPLADAWLPLSEAAERIPAYRRSLERLRGLQQAGMNGEDYSIIQNVTEEVREFEIKKENREVDAVKHARELAAAGAVRNGLTGGASGGAFGLAGGGGWSGTAAAAERGLGSESFQKADASERRLGIERLQKAGASERRRRDRSFRGTADEGSALHLRRPSAVTVELRDAGYRYGGEAACALKHVDLCLPQGAKIAVLGPSGAGKSTLLKLLFGALRPTAGSARIGSRAAADYGERISELVAVLNQAPHLFDDTIAANIRLGRPEATDAEVARAASLARLDAVTESLPLGLATRVEEAGKRFSGGERQRIALARILLQDAPVVLLDEPAAGLDPRTERELLATIFAALEGRTIVWVTHHLAGVERMDEIVFLDRGEITMRGTHAELLAREERYRRLRELDRGDFRREAAIFKRRD
ncbi:amino acid ABC transporter ATP-binding/permease protein [Paenibacillus sp. B01]|uniref:amino acid ABC transporter ATP-binding/permease protein n=1 Tax=Paenibacillus sp. B01 TaxID=2660554 RepID=UPI00129AA5BB|nr:ATP-binding cassette domain-containing protein [Paenibacillus sp. B01]QGG58429.1 ATP-binding cassette domain-containing protein [Paenibacillus sp. B01]